MVCLDKGESVHLLTRKCGPFQGRLSGIVTGLNLKQTNQESGVSAMTSRLAIQPARSFVGPSISTELRQSIPVTDMRQM